MNEFVTSVVNIFNDLLNNPNESAKYAQVLKDTLNAELGAANRNNFKPVTCTSIYVSGRNSTDPFVIAVIPVMPSVGDSILKTDFLRDYEIDLDISNMISHGLDVPTKFTAEELTAWLFHELYQNILTDTTFTRYKKLLIKYYDTKNKAITSAHNNLGYMTWFGVFGNTYKNMISDGSTDYCSSSLKLIELDNAWNMAFRKFIQITGGNPGSYLDSIVDKYDKICLEKFNQLARKYCVYAIKYADRSWKTLINYLGQYVGSKCFMTHITQEPEFIAAIPEKDEYQIFDSAKIMYPHSLRADDPLNESVKTPAEMYAEADNLIIDSKNIYSITDKLYTAAKIKDLLVVVQSLICKNPTDRFLQETKEKLYAAAKNVENANVSAVTALELR